MSTPRASVRIGLNDETIILTPAQVELLRFLAGTDPAPPRRVNLRSYQALAAHQLIATSGDTCAYGITERGKQVFAKLERLRFGAISPRRARSS